MKKRIVSSIVAITIIVMAGLLSTPVIFNSPGINTLSAYESSCKSSVTVWGNPGCYVTYCGPTSGTATLDANGMVTIYSLCTGTYTFCIDCPVSDTYLIGSISVSGEYVSYIIEPQTASVICPCN